MKKILVCITIQENSKRLIYKGSELANALNGSLHILHIQKGETIFGEPDSAELLQELFGYGSELGGEVHFLCSDDITDTINDFVKEMKITHLVLGETPTKDDSPFPICNTLTNTLNAIDVYVLPRTAQTN